MKIKYLIIIIITVVIAVLGFLLINSWKTSDKNNSAEAISSPPSMEENFSYKALNENLLSLLPKDRIPPLEDPKYSKADKVLFLDDKDKVFILEAEENTYIFPQKIMVWHEIVNETIDGDALSITYCPLTGSVIGYEGDIAGHADNTYGTSGKLVNSNLVMYDRKTDSIIPQILGIAIDSSLEGSELTTRPVYWADWADAKAAYPNALVLNLETGYQRDYFTDPYGTYDTESPGSYYTNGEPMYKVINENDGTFIDKKIVVGIKYKEFRAALDPDLVKQNGVYNFIIGGQKIVAFFDENLKTVRVFNSVFNGQILDFSLANGNIIDNRGVQWASNGISTNGESLSSLTHFDVMWFAWYAYYPETDIIK